MWALVSSGHEGLGLSRAWNTVGLCGRDIEPMGDFYAVFFEKLNYWADPRGRELAGTGELDISLEQAEQAASLVMDGESELKLLCQLLIVTKRSFYPRNS